MRLAFKNKIYGSWVSLLMAPWNGSVHHCLTHHPHKTSSLGCLAFSLIGGPTGGPSLEFGLAQACGH